MRRSRTDNSLRLSIPDGRLGTRETLKHMRQLVQNGKFDLANRALANRITARCKGKDWIGELEAIFSWVRDNIRYSLDPNGIETIQGARGTVRQGFGDCDDMAILLATLCECVGHPCCFVALGFRQVGEYEHVLTCATGAGETPWIAMDATEAHPFGWFPKGAVCEMVAPVSETAEHCLGRFPL